MSINKEICQKRARITSSLALVRQLIVELHALEELLRISKSSIDSQLKLTEE